MYSFSSHSAQDTLQILMITDDVNLNCSLVQAGYQVIPITDGVTALTKVQTQTVNLVVIDMMTESLDGLAICRQLRRSSEVPIILLTPNQSDVIISALEIGADDAMSYPVSPEELVARVEALLRRLHRITGMSEVSNNPTTRKGCVMSDDRVYSQYAPLSVLSWPLAIGSS
jgi:two-component system, OmpR family, response regulator ResD